MFDEHLFILKNKIKFDLPTKFFIKALWYLLF